MAGDIVLGPKAGSTLMSFLQALPTSTGRHDLRFNRTTWPRKNGIGRKTTVVRFYNLEAQGLVAGTMWTPRTTDDRPTHAPIH